MKTRTRQVSATTNNITTGIVNFLNSKGHFAFRVNTTGIYDPVARIFRKQSEESEGCSDIISCMRVEGTNYDREANTFRSVGLFYGLEVKNKLTKDKMRKSQLKFKQRVEAAGGVYVAIESYPWFLNWYNQSPFNAE